MEKFYGYFEDFTANPDVFAVISAPDYTQFYDVYTSIRGGHLGSIRLVNSYELRDRAMNFPKRSPNFPYQPQIFIAGTARDVDVAKNVLPGTEFTFVTPGVRF